MGVKAVSNLGGVPSDGEIIATGDIVTVTANANEPTYPALVSVDPVTKDVTVGLPPAVAMATDGQTPVSVYNASNVSRASGSSAVSNGILAGTVLDALFDVLGNGADVNLLNNTEGTLDTGKSLVAADTNELKGISLSGLSTIVKDQDTLLLNQWNGDGAFNTLARVGNNILIIELNSPTLRVIADGLSVSIETAGGEVSISGTLHVDQGALQPAKLPANVGIVQDGVGLTIPLTGTYDTKVTPQVNADGVITGLVAS
ncbi:hypothetical protein C5748_17055 [Phyllobacterium phragmitis]|uniref:Uncharacterized protein n=1 Tax=Phyllobacterium phragmitis TaxID=2670329 RepID=A0A2S9INR8_9HYPH|nr:hypothetical protein [Phyllobacterium phragmitis]PRD42174.1 hypothetical protein C5748_17055 [Phyllobacterium phragmitis]